MRLPTPTIIPLINLNNTPSNRLIIPHTLLIILIRWIRIVRYLTPQFSKAEIETSEPGGFIEDVAVAGVAECFFHVDFGVSGDVLGGGGVTGAGGVPEGVDVDVGEFVDGGPGFPGLGAGWEEEEKEGEEGSHAWDEHDVLVHGSAQRWYGD